MRDTLPFCGRLLQVQVRVRIFASALTRSPGKWVKPGSPQCWNILGTCNRSSFYILSDDYDLTLGNPGHVDWPVPSRMDHKTRLRKACDACSIRKVKVSPANF